jgi:hypothetical protein
VNRRGFLRGLLGVAVAPVAARVAAKSGEFIVDADTVLPEYVGGEAVGLFAHDPTRIVFHGDTVIEGDLEVNGTLTVGGTVTAHDSDAQLDRLLVDIDRAPERNAAMTRELLPLTSADLDRAARDFAAGLKA